MTASVCFAARGSPSADLLLSVQNVSCGLLEWCDQHEAQGNPQYYKVQSTGTVHVLEWSDVAPNTELV